MLRLEGKRLSARLRRLRGGGGADGLRAEEPEVPRRKFASQRCCWRRSDDCTEMHCVREGHRAALRSCGDARQDEVLPPWWCVDGAEDGGRPAASCCGENAAWKQDCVGD